MLVMEITDTDKVANYKCDVGGRSAELNQCHRECELSEEKIH
jgi:hypothetical protein